MKIKLIALLFFFCSSFIFAQNLSLEQAVKSSVERIESRLPQDASVAILVFASSSQNFSDYIIDELATAFLNNNKIKVIDRHNADAIRRELNIQMSDDVSDNEIRRAGQQLGAQYVVTGSLVDIGTAYRFRITAIDVESSVREGASSLNINLNDPQVVFLLTGRRTTQERPRQYFEWDYAVPRINLTQLSAVDQEIYYRWEREARIYGLFPSVEEYLEAVRLHPEIREDSVAYLGWFMSLVIEKRRQQMR